MNNGTLIQGTIISEDMLIFKRPATGLPPNKIHDIIGKRAKNHIDRLEDLSKTNFSFVVMDEIQDVFQAQNMFHA